MVNKKYSEVKYYIEQHLADDIDPNCDSVIVDYYDLKQFFSNEIAGNAFDMHILDFLTRISNCIEKRLILKNHPISHNLKDLEASHIGDVVSFECIIKRISEITPEGYMITYLCKTCLRLIKVFVKQIDLEDPSSIPPKCLECDKRSVFEEVKSETKYFNVRYIKVEEPFENREGGKPRNFNCIIKGQLASPKSNLQLGDKLKMTGIFKEITVEKSRTKKRMFVIDVLDLECIETNYKTLEITQDDENEIIKLSKDPKIFEKLRDSLLPNYIGHRRVKEGLLCQSFSEWGKDGKRQSIHILLVGDPGTNKSQNLIRIKNFSLKSSYTVGGATTEAGLLGSTIRDEITGEWSTEAGLIPMCNDGLLAIDELDKAHHTLLGKLNEAMEQGTSTITKAGGKVTFQAKTAILAGMNPIDEYFNAYKTAREQIKLPGTLYDRFDLVYVLQDIPNEKNDAALVYQLAGVANKNEPLISDEMLQKYINYAKREINPEISLNASHIIKEYYRKLRTIPEDVKRFSNRDVEALLRISKAIARMELSGFVLGDHAKKAIKIFDESIETMNLTLHYTDEPIQIMEVYDSNSLKL